MKQLLLVGTGGALGAMARYLIGLIPLTTAANAFPWQTFIINIIGSFILGIVASYFASTSNTYLFLGIGICGGFTTFSTFSKEAIGLINNEQLHLALLYIFISVLFGCFAFFIGLQMQKWIN